MGIRIGYEFPLVVLWGLKRSGNHAIINWLRPQARFVFIKNIVPIAPISLGERSLPPQCIYNDWVRERLSFGQKLRALVGRTTILASIEDHELTLKPFVDSPAETTNILLLRDPRNLFASRIRKGFKIDHPAYANESGSSLQRVVNLWKSYARECLGETNNLGNKVIIYFPQWFSDVGYRRRISQSLGLAFTDSGFGVVSGHGGGSSFDTTKFDGDAANMKVLERFQQLNQTEQNLLHEMMNDSELKDYAARIHNLFGDGTTTNDNSTIGIRL